MNLSRIAPTAITFLLLEAAALYAQVDRCGVGDEFCGTGDSWLLRGIWVIIGLVLAGGVLHALARGTKNEKREARGILLAAMASMLVGGILWPLIGIWSILAAVLLFFFLSTLSER